MSFKKQDFDNQELALLFQAFGKNLFLRPNKGDIYSDRHDNGCTFYFKSDYYEKLKSDIKGAYDEGKFEQSNAYKEWKNLMDTFLSAENVSELDKQNLNDYYEQVSVYWG